MSREFLEWTAIEKNVRIRHQFNGGGFRVGSRRLAVDGFFEETNTVYQFHRCFWHGHGCRLSANKDSFNKMRNKSFAELRQKRNSPGYILVEMRECKWIAMKEADPTIKILTKRQFGSYLYHRESMTESHILSTINEETMFGLALVGIHILDHLKSKFAQMPPIFKNQLIEWADVGDTSWNSV